jgi:integrase
MAFVRNKPHPKSKKYRAGYTDWRGRQMEFTGTTNPKETLRMAQNFEDRHRKIRLGDLPPPKESDKPHDFQSVMDEYLAWGAAQGGRGGRPWSKTHQRMREAHLAFWLEELSPQTIADVTLSQVEAVVRKLLRSKTPKTAANTTEALRAVCLWSKQRGYMSENPLEFMTGFDTTPKTIRRAMTIEEVKRLLESCRPSRRLLYETALSSGLRAGELRALTVADLDAERCGLKLSAAWTKNRKDGFQPLPAVLVGRLTEHVKGKASSSPLLESVPTHLARVLDKDFKLAKILKSAPGGKLDFHALRTAYVTMLLETQTS